MSEKTSVSPRMNILTLRIITYVSANSSSAVAPNVIIQVRSTSPRSTVRT